MDSSFFVLWCQSNYALSRSAVLTTDYEEVVQTCTNNMSEMLGLSVMKIVGKPLTTLVDAREGFLATSIGEGSLNKFGANAKHVVGVPVEVISLHAQHTPDFKGLREPRGAASS